MIDVPGLLCILNDDGCEHQQVCIVASNVLFFYAHVARIPDHPLPNRVFFGELNSGGRSGGRPHLRYKDTLKIALKRCNIESDSWDILAKDRSAMGGMVSLLINNSSYHRR